MLTLATFTRLMDDIDIDSRHFALGLPTHYLSLSLFCPLGNTGLLDKYTGAYWNGAA
jgi:hypothetical protein